MGESSCASVQEDRFYLVNEGPDEEIERRVITMAYFQSNFLALESPDKVEERRPDEFLKR